MRSCAASITAAASSRSIRRRGSSSWRHDMRVEVVTLFPAVFAAPAGVVGRALAAGRVRLACVNPRDFATDRHRTVDDAPYGGGAGMILKAPPLVEAVESVVGAGNPRRVPVVLL